MDHLSLLGYRHKIMGGISILPKAKNELFQVLFVLILKREIPFEEKT